MAGPYQQPPAPPPPPPPPPHGYPAPYQAPAAYAPPYGYGVPYPVLRPGPAPGLAYAGFWIRFVGYFIDALILDIPLYGLLIAIFGSQLWTFHCTNNVPVSGNGFGNRFGNGFYCSGEFTGLFYLGWLVITLLHGVYFAVLWSRAGRTIGQMAVGLWVVDARNGARISLGKAIGRYLGFLVSSIPFSLGLMWAGWDPQKQGWHDKMAATFVVRKV